MEINEKKKIRDALLVAFIMVSVLWIVKLIEVNFDISFASYGVYPRKAKGLIGILTAPLIHQNFKHLWGNSAPLFVAVTAIVYLYRPVAFRIIFISWISSHFLVWIMARDSYHIGASGLVYALLSFLFFATAFSKNKNLLAISLAIIFIYGAMIWGIIPVETHISWESHLMGAIVGFALAMIYKNKGPKPEVYDWENEEENIDELSDDEINELIDEKMRVKYWYKKQK